MLCSGNQCLLQKSQRAKFVWVINIVVCLSLPRRSPITVILYLILAFTDTLMLPIQHLSHKFVLNFFLI